MTDCLLDSYRILQLPMSEQVALVYLGHAFMAVASYEGELGGIERLVHIPLDFAKNHFFLALLTLTTSRTIPRPDPHSAFERIG